MIYFVCFFDSVDCVHYVSLKKTTTTKQRAGHFILFYSVSLYYCIIFKYIINVETVSLYIIYTMIHTVWSQGLRDGQLF